MSRFQRNFNNAIINVDKLFNEVVYNFTSIQILNLFSLTNFLTNNLFLKKCRLIIKHEIIDVIIFK